MQSLSHQYSVLGDLCAEDLVFFRELIHSVAGIYLPDRKADLIVGRLKPFLARSGYSSFSAYRDLLDSSPHDSDAIQAFVNLMTTNKTQFFREATHFDYLVQEVIPSIMGSNVESKQLRIWCAASSTGEEAYSIAMCLEHSFGGKLDYSILASDIDTAVIERARNGVYPVTQLAEIPEEYRQGMVQIGQGATSGWMKMSDRVHQRVRFRNFNLVTQSASPNRMFDVVFCRNVFIYFSPYALNRCLQLLHRHLENHGYLFIGHSEALPAASTLFQKTNPATFRKRPS